jgi:hypothetical protein
MAGRIHGDSKSGFAAQERKQKMLKYGKTFRNALFLFLAISLFALPGVAAQNQEEDNLRRVWNKKFIEARQKSARIASASPGRRKRGGKDEKAARVKPVPASAAGAAESLDGDLVGVTLWRLAESSPKVDKDQPRIIVQQPDGRLNPLVAERVIADTVFHMNQRVRVGVEVPRDKNGYLYVIDREVYADGTMSEPYLIFPSRSTPSGGNRITAGKVIYVPAQGDPHPYFNIQRSRTDQVSELLTIIITPTPLDVQPGPPNAPAELDSALVASWEQQWGGRTERRELQGGAGASWTAREKEAGEGKRKLLQDDPLPQTVYFIAGKRGEHTLVNVPLRIAP